MVIVDSESGGRLEFREVPDPTPADGELLVEVRATALNRADLSQRAGRYRQEATANRGPMQIAGLESAGVVVACGADVYGVSVGDRIMAMCGGGYAERLIVDHRLAIRVPDRMSWTEAAATPVAFMTEHDALVTNAEFASGESVLITAASSAVGLVGTAIAAYLGASPVIGTLVDNTHADTLRAQGADVVVNSRTQDFAAIAREATGGRGVDIIIDHVGGPELPTSLRALALKGRLVSVGRLGAVMGELDMDLLARERLRLIGVSFRTRTIDEYAAVAQRMVADLWPALDAGIVRPVIDRTFALDEAEEAQARMAANAHLGKIVLEVHQ